jgi:MinD-like ATPase involved in chromosome partitioning or flagellar assembly
MAIMSEPHSSEFDEHAALPQPVEPDKERESEGPAPALGRVPWPTPEPAGDPISSLGEPDPPPPATPTGFPAPPPGTGAHRATPDTEATSIVDRRWLADQIEQMDQDRAADPNHAIGGPPRPFGSQAHRPSEMGQQGPSWPQAAPRPPTWSQRQEGSQRGASPAQDDWSSAQGSSASWNYVDNSRSSELVPTRRIPPSRGWRKGLYYSTFKLINPGQSSDERYEAELVKKVRSLVRGTYNIGVLGKGGAGKSTVAAAVGSIFAELRKDDRVVAVDADTAFGKLGARVDPKVSGSYWELAADRNLDSFGDIRSRLGSNAGGLFVLIGPPETARRRVLDPTTYRAATAQLDRFFSLSIVDCGSTMDSPLTREVLNDVDALIVVSSPWFDGAKTAGETLEWLANGGYTALLHRTVVVVNDSDGHADKGDLKLLVERFGKHGQKVVQLPYDQHLRPGGVVDVKDEINALTRRRLLELAAECAEHFASTSDRPQRSGGAQGNPGQHRGL